MKSAINWHTVGFPTDDAVKAFDDHWATTMI